MDAERIRTHGAATQAKGRPRQWISTGEAARILDVGPASVRQIVQAGRIRRRDVPGSRETLLRADVERLAAEFIGEPVSA